MQPQYAYKSLKEIANSWLLKKEKHQNSMWKVLALAQEAVQELALTSLPLVQHALLRKPDGQNWFDLPADFSAAVSVGIRAGQVWRPLGISTTLMPFGARSAGGSLNAAAFGAGLVTTAGQGSWNDYEATAPSNGSLNEDDFSSDDFHTEGAAEESTDNSGGLLYDLRRTDTVVFNVAEGQVLTHSNFPGAELYLVYVGFGNINTSTQIPIIAQAAIEAYIDWKYAQNKRDGLREAGLFLKLYNRQHRILRARLNDLTTTDIKQIRNARWRNPRAYGMTLSATTTTINSTTTPTVATTFYFGTMSSAGTPSIAQIELMTSQAIPSDGSKVIQFTNTTDEYLVFAYPATEDDPTTYYVGPLDNGTLGSGSTGATFAEPVTVGDYRVIISNFKTQIADPVTFS